MEEELTLLDPDSLDLAPRAPELLRTLADPARFHPELSPAQIEIVSSVFRTAEEAAAAVANGRAVVLHTTAGEVRLAGIGAHPFAEPWSAISSGRRYASIARRYRWGARRGGLAAGLHVHLGILGNDRLLAVYNAIRGYMPELAALAASAPFLGGRDTGLASIRPTLADALPRQGVGPAFPTWGAYAALLAWGRSSGAFRDHTELWWECRLHPGFGTIEVRVPDAQAAIEDVAATAALVHGLAHWLASRYDHGDPLPTHPTRSIAENRWRAAADGVEGELIDLDRSRMVQARRHLARLIDTIGPCAPGQADGRAIERAGRWLRRPRPTWQRAIASERGLRALTAALADSTESGACETPAAGTP
ncbi:MAG TPA: YbdK family carboxylate-amine ligase [Gaiellales bacterium]|nr:YbdK family carboxylate-amine ligase [Gaiellales bacterium]